MRNADDLKFLLELARTGRLVEAGRRLGVEHTTVARRIANLERQVGERLFDRLSSGWRLTERGRQLLPYAETIDSAMTAAFGDTGKAQTLSGTVRLAAPDGFGAYVLTPGLGRLREDHPDLAVEVTTATSNLSLGARDFDLAVTLERPTSRAVMIRRLTDYSLKLYASEDYLARHEPITSTRDLVRHTIIWYIDSILDVQPLKSLSAILPDCKATIQTNNISGHLTATKAGLGLSLLPTYIGATEPKLCEVLPEEIVGRRTYWVVVMKELSHLRRVQAVDSLLTSLVADSSVFE
ncbi:LysR family transcriptional regulator [Prauserella halophila]|uniref:LysR family transcriptional regulator n=1 Tax=Prauserella halophila TaxID=185641 RepID=A0ABP4GUG2_9PSEU|nr:LysR family transcriptional regulator [Prauserella halophila]MCP2235807.1 DNA-binding transcriptional regulator, LysR family [Prauserella halophila]